MYCTGGEVTGDVVTGGVVTGGVLTGGVVTVLLLTGTAYHSLVKSVILISTLQHFD